MKLRFLSDPGHGWLEVPYKTYLGSGIQASAWSYANPELTKVYLEEDCDANLFIKAMNDLAITVEFNNVNYNSDCKVRNYPRIPGHKEWKQ